MDLSGQRVRVAVLSKKPLSSHPYPEWFSASGLATEVVLFAEDTVATRRHPTDGYADVQLFTGWKTNRLVDLAVLRAHARAPFDAVVALSECDVVRAAQLRERLGLRGQQPPSAIAYRDKASMKAHAAAAGVPVPAYAPVDTIEDLLAFAADHERLVVKPRSGAGALDVHRLTGDQEVARWAEEAGLDSDTPAELLVEEFVEGAMYCADGIASDGKLLVSTCSRYTVPPLDSLERLAPLGLLALDPADPLADELRDLASRMVAALPAVDGMHSIHCEVFQHPRRGLVVCEIASRTGGGNIRWMAQHMLGVDLEAEAARGQAGLASAPTVAGEPRDGVAGFVLFLREGQPVAVELSVCPVTGVVRMHRRDEAGGGPARKVSECSLDVDLVAPDHAGLLAAHADVVSWARRTLRG